MRLSRRFLSFFVAVLLVSASRSARGDSVITSFSSTSGKLISIAGDSIAFQPGCSGATETIAWKDILLLRLDAKCTPQSILAPTAPLQACKTPLVRVLKTMVHGKLMYLQSVSMKPGGVLRGIPFGKQGGVVFSRNDVESIQPVDACPTYISDLDLPSQTCFEPSQWAVNWSTEPVFNNQIFTKGFAIYINPETPISDDVRSDIRTAFGTAVNIWASLLFDHRKELSPGVTAYIARSTSSNEHVTLFTPPQVIEVQCKDDALIVVDWFNQKNKVFPKQEGYIARAQLQGRTVLMNAYENTFGYHAQLLTPLTLGEVNLVSVFVHEFGHCLGLPDDSTDATSVMNPAHIVSEIGVAVWPTVSDFDRLRKSLEAAIQGSSAGYFDVKDCAGLRWTKTTKPRHALSSTGASPSSATSPVSGLVSIPKHGYVLRFRTVEPLRRIPA